MLNQIELELESVCVRNASQLASTLFVVDEINRRKEWSVTGQSLGLARAASHLYDWLILTRGIAVASYRLWKYRDEFSLLQDTPSVLLSAQSRGKAHFLLTAATAVVKALLFIALPIVYAAFEVCCFRRRRIKDGFTSHEEDRLPKRCNSDSSALQLSCRPIRRNIHLGVFAVTFHGVWYEILGHQRWAGMDGIIYIGLLTWYTLIFSIRKEFWDYRVGLRSTP